MQPNIAAESYGRAMLNKLDFLGMSPEVSVFKVSFNLTLIPIDGAVLRLVIVTHDSVTHGQVFLSLTFLPASAMDKHYSAQS